MMFDLLPGVQLKFHHTDSSGDAKGSGAGKIQHCMSALHAEAMACLQALQAATEWGMVHVQIETDSTTLVRAL
jgi:ribonuclease HI